MQVQIWCPNVIWVHNATYVSVCLHIFTLFFFFFPRDSIQGVNQIEIVINLRIFKHVKLKKKKMNTNNSKRIRQPLRTPRETDLTFRSPHHIRGLSDGCVTNSNILLSHFLLLGNEFSSSFQPLFGAYVFKKRNVSNSAKITRPSVSCFEANNKDKRINWLQFHC